MRWTQAKAKKCGNCQRYKAPASNHGSAGVAMSMAAGSICSNVSAWICEVGPYRAPPAAAQPMSGGTPPTGQGEGAEEPPEEEPDWALEEEAALLAAHEEEARPRPQRVDSRDRELQQRELFVPRCVVARIWTAVEHAELWVGECNEVIGARPRALACKG